MITIKRTSWHYRLNNKMDINVEHYGMNLCKYFWTTVWNTLLMLLLALSALTLFGVLVYLLITEIPLAILFTLFAACIVFPATAIHYFRKIFPNTTIPTPNLIKEYIKAKKEKYCPMITFE